MYSPSTRLKMAGGFDVALPPESFKNLASGISDQVYESNEKGISPVLVTSSRRRRFILTVARTHGVSVPVLSFDEIGMEAKPALVGVVDT